MRMYVLTLKMYIVRQAKRHGVLGYYSKLTISLISI